jgi:SWI/SNF-related matrix-associated actin-dependent regulator of chromatin subfamily A3
MSTKQFQAIDKFMARNRWCLTGTPIQNSLDDLASLMKFLRVPLFGEPSKFQKFVTIPAMSKGHDKYTNLRLLLSNLCLRRTRTVLSSIPEPIDNVIELAFCEDEKREYDDFIIQCQREIGMAVSGRNGKKIHQCVLELLLRLRLFCNHGMMDEFVMNRPLGFPSDPEDALSYLQSLGEAMCALCSCDITAGSGNESTDFGTLTTCYHLVCQGCRPQFLKQNKKSKRADSDSYCSVCKQQTSEQRVVSAPNDSPMDVDDTTVFSTKLQAIVSKLKISQVGDKR